MGRHDHDVDFIAKARTAWSRAAWSPASGGLCAANDLPAWVEALASAVNGSSQTEVAKRLGVSNGLVSAVLSASYKGDLAAVHARVAGALMGARVTCPVLGDIGRDRCISEQATPFRATNPHRVQLWQACRSGCPNAKPLKGDRHDI